MNSHGQHLERAISEQYARVIERIDDQVEQRVETAEIAVESAMIESEESGQPVNAQQLVSMVEHAAGLKIQMDSASLAGVRDDPGVFLEQIPQLVEASMGVRLWAGLLHSVERRVGEPLGLEPRLTAPIDWDQAEQDLMDALKTVWRARTEGILEDIKSELDQLLQADVRIDQALKLRLLIQLSYGQRSYFDKKSHQRRSVLVARLSYPFYAANIIPTHEPEDLTTEVLEHLELAQLTLQRKLGKAELERLGKVSAENLDDRTRELLRNNLPEETVQTYITNQSLLPAQRDEIAQILGAQVFTRAHRELILSVGDQQWVEYLTEMEALRTSIGLEAYAQRDPLVQYKSRAFDLFGQLLATIRAGVVSKIFRLRVASKSAGAAVEPRTQAAQLKSNMKAQEAESEKPKKRRKRRRKRR
jgi:preprotein translocase subunit SecA